MIAAQLLHVQHVKENTPLAEIKLGEARTIKTYSSVAHVIELTELKNNLNKLESSLQNLQDEDSNDSITPIQRKIDQAREKIYSLTPNRREKRGLIDGLGNVIKKVTGNMDAEDAAKIETKFKQVFENEENINKNLGQQISYNNDIIVNFNNMSDHFYKEQEKIERYINNFKNGISKELIVEDKKIRILQILNIINNNIDILQNHIHDIAESILLAKFKIIPNFILPIQELKDIAQIFKLQNFSINSEEHIYRLLNIEIESEKTKIIFHIKIPIFDKYTYTLSHLIKLPINGTNFLTLPKYILYDDKFNYMLSFQEKCSRIHGTYICDPGTAESNMDNRECVKQVLQGMNPVCEAKIINTDEAVVEPEQQWIVIISKNQLRAEPSCAEPFTIEGTTIINHINCSIFIDGTKYDDSELFYQERIKLSLPVTKNISINATSEDLSLSKIVLHLQENKAKIFQVKESTINLRFITYASSIILVIFILYALAVRRNTTYLPNPVTSVNYVPSIPSLWPSLYSRGGGVTTSTSTSPPPKPPRQNH